MNSNSSLSLFGETQLPNLQLFATQAVDYSNQSYDDSTTLQLTVGESYDLTSSSLDPKIQAQFLQFQLSLRNLLLEIPNLRKNQNKKSKLIRRLKKVKVSRKHTCCVCHEKCIREAEVVKLDCNHIYHEECINQWLDKKSTCPLCRETVK